MRKQNIDIWGLNSRIGSGDLSDSDLRAVSTLAEVNVEAVVPKSGHPDPPLTCLVRDLSPIWSSVTGTSSYPKNNREGKKVSPLAKWIGELISAAGLHPPPENTVSRLVRLQKIGK